MTRAHINKPILDAAGNVRTGSLVRVLEPGTTTPVTDLLYSASMGSATRTNPFLATDGVVDFYLATPARVRLGVIVGQEAEVFFDDVDVIVAMDAGGNTTSESPGIPLTTARIEGDLHFDNTVTTAIKVYRLQGNPLAWVEVLLGGPPTDLAVADPETGATTTFVPNFGLQTIVSGPLVVATDIAKPGLRVIKTSTARVLVVHLGIAPTGSAATIYFYRVNGGTPSALGTVTIAAGQTVGSLEINVACAKGDLIRFDVTAVGSTTPGSDANLAVDFA